MSPSGAASPDSASARSIAYHDRLADGWDQRYGRGGFQRRADLFTRAVLPNLDCRGDWIDVGCGSGYFSRVLAERGASVLGIDGSAAMVAAARAAIAPGRTLALRYEVATIESLDAPTLSFDGAICLSVLEYLDDPAAAVARLAGLLRPGGCLVVSVPNRLSVVRRSQHGLRRALLVVGFPAFDYLERSRQSWSRAALQRLALQNGLAVEALVGFDPRIPRALWRMLPPSLFFIVCRKAMGARQG